MSIVFFYFCAFSFLPYLVETIRFSAVLPKFAENNFITRRKTATRRLEKLTAATARMGGARQRQGRGGKSGDGDHALRGAAAARLRCGDGDRRPARQRGVNHGDGDQRASGVHSRRAVALRRRRPQGRGHGHGDQRSAAAVMATATSAA